MDNNSAVNEKAPLSGNGKLFVIIGKSSSGKDTIFKSILEDSSIPLKRLITYTTRPIRSGEKEGNEYHFTDAAGLAALESAGLVVEKRTYDTIYGPWTYFTAINDNIRLDKESYIVISTPTGFLSLKDYYSKKGIEVIPIYIYVDDYVLLTRAINREHSQQNPKYTELCRRFIADSKDFSDKKLSDANINVKFTNDKLSVCIEDVKKYILSFF